MSTSAAPRPRARGGLTAPPGWGPPPWARLWLPVIISFFVQVPAELAPLNNRWMPPGFVAPFSPVSLSLALIGPLALVWARRFPGPVVATVTAAAMLDLFFGRQDLGPPNVALGFAIIGAVVRGARLWAWLSVAAAGIASFVIALALGVTWHPGRIAALTLGVLIVIGIGEGFRTRVERAAEARRLAAERQASEVQAERVRIARELHDVLAHSLSQINVQAGVGLHLMERQPEKAADALASIKETSKTALDEVRSVLGILRAEGGSDPAAPLVPEPDLSRLPGLAASVISQGVEVTIVGALDPAPSKAVQLAIYRIVQESLTNVVRHAGARHATVTLERLATAYRVRIDDDGRGAPATPGGGGRGLLGMRERAELLGGSLSAGPGEHGGFSVLAEIPAPTGEAP